MINLGSNVNIRDFSPDDEYSTGIYKKHLHEYNFKWDNTTYNSVLDISDVKLMNGVLAENLKTRIDYIIHEQMYKISTTLRIPTLKHNTILAKYPKTWVDHLKHRLNEKFKFCHFNIEYNEIKLTQEVLIHPARDMYDRYHPVLTKVYTDILTPP